MEHTECLVAVAMFLMVFVTLNLVEGCIGIASVCSAVSMRLRAGLSSLKTSLSVFIRAFDCYLLLGVGRMAS